MSDTIPLEKQAASTALSAAILTAPPGTEPSWAKPAISVLSMVVFVALIVVAYLRNDVISLGVLTGVGVGMAQQVAGYYLGSSSGSAQKTNLLAAASPVPVTTK